MPFPFANVPARSVKPLYLTAAASGLLLYSSFFPLNLGFLAWIALVPLLFLVRSDARPRHVYLAAFFGGLVFYVPAIQWMRVAHIAMYGTWIMLSIYCALYFPFCLCLIRKLDRGRVPLTVAVPTVWVGLEYMRAHFPTGFPWMESLGILHRIGFPWYFLGYSQHDYLPVIQIADLAGVYGVSFLVLLGNAAIFQWLARWAATGSSGRCAPWLSAAAAAVLVACTIAYGYSRLDHEPFAAGPRLAMLQSDLPQSVKSSRGSDDHTVEKHMVELLLKSVTSPDEFPNLVVWPETTFSDDWYDVASGVSPSTTPPGWQQQMAESRKLARIIGKWKATQLLGLNGMEMEADGTIWKYNSALLIDRDGTAGPRYDKMHLVPFGEYVPLRSTFPWMSRFTPYKGDYSCKPGEHWTRFPLEANGKTYQFGCLICYEDSDPTLARTYVAPSAEAPVDFFVNISNDGWFNGTEEHEQHLAICRFRAVECRRSVARAVNMGISGIIDGDGRIVKIPGPTWAESKRLATVVNGIVPIDNRESLYARWGDWLPIACWTTFVAALLLTMRRRRIEALA
jgi:apolipoprotein N-acyltransferase